MSDEGFYAFIIVVLLFVCILLFAAVIDLSNRLPENAPSTPEIVACAKTGGELWFSYNVEDRRINNAVCLKGVKP